MPNVETDLLSQIPIETLRQMILGQFKCQKSGNCCKASGYVHVTPDEITALAKANHQDVVTFQCQTVIRENGWPVISTPNFRPLCFLKSDHSCSVYEARPIACRTYPNWSSIWESHKTFLAETTTCPGLKKAAISVQTVVKNTQPNQQ